jgi:hypothetical protein
MIYQTVKRSGIKADLSWNHAFMMAPSDAAWFEVDRQSRSVDASSNVCYL